MSAGRGYTAGMKPLALVPFVVLALAGCGNKGPLVMPDAPPEPAEAPAAEAPASDAAPATGTPAARR